MATIVVSPFDVVGFPEGGGHFWVYMQYVQSLRRLGCDVYWLEQLPAQPAERALATFRARMARFGMEGRCLLYRITEPGRAAAFVDVEREAAEAVLRRADLLLNFHYAIDPYILSLVRRSALVDIDPGLTQIWITTGQLQVPPHDVYFTIGEHIGGRWIPSRPPVCLDLWPALH